MALRIKTEEADRLVCEFSRLAGETMIEAITRAKRKRQEQEGRDDYIERVQILHAP